MTLIYLKSYRVPVSVEDEPASAEYVVRVMAYDGTEARTIARKAVKEAYLDDAGGWALKPHYIVGSAELAPIPETPAVIAVSGGVER